MTKKIYVGNLAFSVTESSLNELFGQYGRVDSCRLISDRDTGRSKGFGFVEMSTDEEAQSAIGSLNGKEFDGRALTVNEARPQEGRPREFSSRNEGFSGGGSSSSYGSDRRGGSRY